MNFHRVFRDISNRVWETFKCEFWAKNRIEWIFSNFDNFYKSGVCEIFKKIDQKPCWSHFPAKIRVWVTFPPNRFRFSNLFIMLCHSGINNVNNWNYLWGCFVIQIFLWGYQWDFQRVISWRVYGIISCNFNEVQLEMLYAVI